MNELVVAAQRGPLRHSREIVYEQAGASISELIERHAPIPDGESFWVEARIGGIEVPRDHWDRIRPKPGQTVAIDVLPTGGENGSKIAGALLIVVGLLTVLWGGWTLFGPGASLTTAEIAATAAITASGALAIASGVQSLLAPPPRLPFTGDVPTSNQPALLSGTRNSVRYNGPIRRVFGQMRVFPDFGAKPFTEVVGSDQFLRLLYHVGYGPLLITELKIGDTDLATLGLVAGTDYIVHNGFDDDGDLTLVTQDVDEDRSFSLPMFPESEEYVITGALDTEEFSVDWIFPAGLIGYKDTGEPFPATVVYEVSYRLTSEEDPDPWTLATFITPLNPGMTALGSGQVQIDGKIRGTVTYGVAVKFPTRDQYDVKCKVISLETAPSQDSIVTDANWVVLRSMRPFAEATFTNLCRIELRVRATDLLSGLLDTFNCKATSIYPRLQDDELGYYDQRRLIDFTQGRLVASRAHDLAFVEVMKGPGNPNPVGDESLDIASMKAWSTYMGTIGRTFDGVLEAFGTVHGLISDIAGAGRAAPSIVDGKYGVVLNNKKTVLVDHISHRNSYGFSSFRAFRDTVHALKVAIIDPNAGWGPNEITVYNDGYDASNATVFDSLNLWGITDADAAAVEARLQLAEWELRPRILSASVGLRSLRLQRGDLVRCNFTVIGKGLSAGRLTGVTINGGNIEGGTTDEAIIFGAESYAIRIQTADGETIIGDLVPDAGQQQAFTFATPIAIPGDDPAPGDHFMFGERGEESGEFVVYQIAPEAGLRARVEFVDHAPAIFDADTDPIPDYDPGVTRTTPIVLATPGQPQIEHVISDESVLKIGKDGSLTPQILIGWSMRENPEVKAAQFQIQLRVTTGPSEWLDQGFRDSTQRDIIFDAQIAEGTDFDVRMRAISNDGRFSEWESQTGNVVVGTSTPPPAIENLRRDGLFTIAWDYPSPPLDLKGFRIRRSSNVIDPTWRFSNDVQDGFTTETFIDPRQFTPPTSEAFSLLIAAEDRSGNVSDALFIVLDLGVQEPPNTVDTYDHRTGAPVGDPPGTAWGGTKNNMTIDGTSGDLESDGDPAVLFWSGDAGPFWLTSTDPFWTGGFLAWSYVTGWWDPGSAQVGGTLFLRTDIESADRTIFFQTRNVGGGGESTPIRFGGEYLIESAHEYQFIIAGPVSNSQTKIIELVLVVGKEDTVVYINDWYNDSSSSSQRIPLALIPVDYLLVRTVLVTVVGDPDTVGPIGARVLDKGLPNNGTAVLTSGPDIEVLGISSGSVVGSSADIDVEIRGYI